MSKAVCAFAVVGILLGGGVRADVPTTPVPILPYSLQATPNPAKDVLTVVMTAPPSARIRLDLVDLAGRRFPISQGRNMGGGGGIWVPLPRSVHAGVYFLLLIGGVEPPDCYYCGDRGGRIVAVQRVVVVR